MNLIGVLLNISDLQKVVRKDSEIYGFSSRVYFKLIPGHYEESEVQVMRNLTLSAPFFWRKQVKVLAHVVAPARIFACSGWRSITVSPVDGLKICGRNYSVEVIGGRAEAKADIELIGKCASALCSNSVKLLFLQKQSEPMLLAELKGTEKHLFLIFAGGLRRW